MDGMGLSLKTRRNIRFVAWSTVLSWGMLLSHTAGGQGRATASMVGTVQDSAGAVIPGAEIVITQTSTGFSQSALSAEDGSFAFPVLPIGPYRLETRMTGFAPYQQTGIVLTVNQVAKVSVILQLRQIAESVTVTAGASQVDTSTGTLSRLIDQRQVVDLPLNGRNPSELVLLAAGVSNLLMNSTIPAVPLQFSYPAGVGGSGEGQGALAPIVNGLRPGGVYFSLDGASNLDAYGVTGGPFPNPDAVEEFRVLTSGYGAEYVSAPGGVVNIVTKSGTNAFHGNVFEFIRNGALNARNFFAAKQDNIRRNQYGFTAGGPIRKDKLFIFGSYQGTSLRSSVGGNIQFVPTDAQRAGDFSSTPVSLKNPFTGAPYPENRIPVSDFNPVTTKILQRLPRSSAPDGRVEVVRPTSQNEDQFVVKGDYLLRKHSFVTRYFFSDFRQAEVPVQENLLQVGGANTFRWQDAMLGHNYTGGSWINEFRFTFQRNASKTFSGFRESFKSLGARVTESQNPFIEFIQVAGFFVIPGGSFNGFPRETFTLSNRASLTRGRHQLSLGIELQRLRATEFTDHFQSGVAIWAPLPPDVPFTSGNIVSDFLLGKATAFGQGDGLLARARGGLWGFSITDQIRVTPRLNLSLGVRWDPYWPFHTLNGRATCFRPGQKSAAFTNAPTGLLFPGDPSCDESGTDPDLRSVQPRVGFAYSLDQKGSISIRGGYGMYAMQFPMQSFLPFAEQQPYIRTFFRSIPPSVSDPWGDFPGGDPFSAGFRADDLPRPSNVAFALPVRAASFQPDFKLANVQQWNLTLERLFWGNTVGRVSYVGTKGTHLSLIRERNAAVYIPGQSTTQNTDARRPFSNLASVSMTESAGTSSYQALQLSVERRFHDGLSVSSNYTWGKALDTVSQNANATLRHGFNSASNPLDLKAYRGLSDFDLSHSWATSFVWQLPSSKNGNFFLKDLASGWQASGIWVWQVGQPFSVYSGVDNSLSGVGLDFADRVPGVSPFLSPNRPRGEVVNQYFNLSAFQPNAEGTFGNSGRNVLRAPGYNNLDFAVIRRFPFKQEKYAVTFRAEFFNVTNTPHFTAPGAAGPGGLSTLQGGKILRARDPRILQFALKLNW